MSCEELLVRIAERRDLILFFLVMAGALWFFFDHYYIAPLERACKDCSQCRTSRQRPPTD